MVFFILNLQLAQFQVFKNEGFNLFAGRSLLVHRRVAAKLPLCYGGGGGGGGGGTGLP